MFAEIVKDHSWRLRDFTGIPTIEERERWNCLSDSLKAELIKNGEEYQNYTFPQISACDYLEYTRTGNRTHFQEKQEARRVALCHLTLAECVENQGRFLDDIVNGIYAVCEETAWQLPAHNLYVRDTPAFPLPDVSRPVVDLIAAETAALLGLLEYVLRKPLEAISPWISKMVFARIKERVLKPYLTEHFWWMGNGSDPVNNWCIWCTQNVLMAAMTQPVEQKEREEILQKACQSIDYFLDEYGEDGCCEEGAQYFRASGLCLFGALELLNNGSDQAFAQLYHEKKIQNIASYIYQVHVDGAYYINFADCSPIAGRCTARDYLFGKRTENPALTAFAVHDFKQSEDRLIHNDYNLYYHFLQVFAYDEMMTADCTNESRPGDIYYPSVELFIARDHTYCFAIKGGCNGDSHNHNDVGSFTVYKNGRPMFIDLGVETYTKKTFSPERYEIWTMQSQYHNLPTFDGVMQKDGTEYHAVTEGYSFDETHAAIAMEIAGAYPDGRIRSYRRSVDFQKQTESCDSRITIHDSYDGELRPVVWNLMTCEKPVIDKNEIRIGELGAVTAAGVSDISCERIAVTDPRLQKTWKQNVYRIQLVMEENEFVLTI